MDKALKPPCDGSPLTADPRLSKLFREIAGLLGPAVDVLRETWDHPQHFTAMQTIAAAGYLADHGVLLTAGAEHQYRGDAVQWMAPVLAEAGAAEHHGGAQ